jgi:RNA polymerase sigma factor (sigma-70 family)
MAQKIAQIGRKERAAEAWLVTPELARLAYAVAASYRLNSEDAEEVLQEVRIALWQAGLELRVCRAWIVGTAAHKAIDLLRNTIRRSGTEKACVRAADSHEKALELEYLLHSRVAELPEPLRDFYELHYGLGLTEREIAVVLEVSRGSVRLLNSRCRRALTGPETTPGSAHTLGTHHVARRDDSRRESAKQGVGESTAWLWRGPHPACRPLASQDMAFGPRPALN